METFELLKYGGREGKGTFRSMTLDEALLLNECWGEMWFKAQDGSARRCRINGKLKRWKRDPNRFELPIKYGMYECARFSNDDLPRMLIELS